MRTINDKIIIISELINEFTILNVLNIYKLLFYKKIFIIAELDLNLSITGKILKALTINQKQAKRF